MVVSDFNIISIASAPDETYSILIVDSYAVLALPVAIQCFELIARKDRQIAQLTRRI